MLLNLSSLSRWERVGVRASGGGLVVRFKTKIGAAEREVTGRLR